jgi:hypothetical protein
MRKTVALKTLRVGEYRLASYRKRHAVRNQRNASCGGWIANRCARSPKAESHQWTYSK